LTAAKIAIIRNGFSSISGKTYEKETEENFFISVNKGRFEKTVKERSKIYVTFASKY
jgi:hypothetical protein